MKEKRNGCTNSSPVSIVSSLRLRFDFKKPILKLPLHINPSGGSRARGGRGGGRAGKAGPGGNSCVVSKCFNLRESQEETLPGTQK